MQLCIVMFNVILYAIAYLQNLSTADILVPDYTGSNMLSCPCISHYGPVDYNCLFQKIRLFGSIPNKCLQIIRELSKSKIEFNLEESASSSSDCENSATEYDIFDEKPRHQTSGRLTKNIDIDSLLLLARTRDQPSTALIPLNKTFCEKVTRKFSLKAEDKRFYDLVQSNIEQYASERRSVGKGENPFKSGDLTCSIFVFKMLKKHSTSCGVVAEEDKCKFNPSISFRSGQPMVNCGNQMYELRYRYANGTFSLDYSRRHVQTWYADDAPNFAIGKQLTDPEMHSLSLGPFLIGDKNIDRVRLGVSCTWELEKKLENDPDRSRINIAAQNINPATGLSKIERIVGKVVKFQQFGSELFANWNPNLKLSKLRVFRNSSLTFSVKWNCVNAWFRTGQYAVSCLFSQNGSAAQGGIDWESVNDRHLGPTVSIQVPQNQTHFDFHLQTRFENRTTSYGKLVLPENVLPLAHILKYDYFGGHLSKYGDYWHKKSHEYSMSKSQEFLEQAVLLPGLQKDPQPLSDVEISNLQITCKVKASIDSGAASAWAGKQQFAASKTVQPLRFITVTGPEDEHTNSYRDITEISYDVVSSRFSKKLLYKSYGTAALVGSTYYGMTFIKGATKKTCDDESVYHGKWTNVPEFIKNCADEWGKTPLRTKYNMRRVGCYHWTFKRWYVFLQNKITRLHELVYFDGHPGQLYWNEIGWRRFNGKLITSQYPTDIKCPNLHSFLVWSELDVEEQVHMKFMELNRLSGEPVEKVKELSHPELCRCSRTSVVSIPPFDLLYPDLNEPESIDLAVLCGQNICATSLGALGIFKGQARQINNKPLENNTAWFQLDQQHIFYYLNTNKSDLGKRNQNNRNLLIAYHGGDVTRKQGNKNQLVEITMSSSDAIYFSIHSPKDHQFVPAASVECLRPKTLDPIEFKMVTKSAANLYITGHLNNSAFCINFAHPGFVYLIQYTTFVDKAPKANLTSLWCKGSRDDVDNDVQTSCMENRLGPSRNLSLHYVLGNLIPGVQYFIQLTVLLDMEQKLQDLWFAGTRWPSQKAIVNATYIPPDAAASNDLRILLGVGIPVIFGFILLWLALLWWHKRRMQIYQYLTRLSKSDIHRELKLGEGHFGEVWRAQLGKETVVVKMLKESASEKEEKEFREEALLISKFQSDFIIKTVGICLQTRPIMLALEYANGGSLGDYLKQKECRMIIEVHDLFHIAENLLNACVYLESEGFIHRDISARNCLVFLKGGTSWKPKLAKLSDFGLAKDTGREDIYKVRDIDGNMIAVAWTSPEGFSGTFSSKSDVWAFGVLLWEIFSFGATPFGQCYYCALHQCPMADFGHAEIELKVCIEKKSLADLDDPCTAAFCSTLKQIMSACWIYNPVERPSFKQLRRYLSGAQKVIQKVAIPDFSSEVRSVDSVPGNHDMLAPVYVDTQVEIMKPETYCLEPDFRSCKPPEVIDLVPIYGTNSQRIQ